MIELVQGVLDRSTNVSKVRTIMKNPTKILSENTVDQVLAMIGPDKKYQVGDKLPNENELSEMMGVSRSTLREAIKMLVAGGALEVKRGLGTYVSNQNSLDYAGLKKLATSACSVYDAFELRLMFEPRCAGLAAERATEEERNTIVEWGNQLICLLNSNEPSAEADQGFHQSIVAATHNQFVKQLLPVIYEGIQKGIHLLQQNQNFFEDTINDTKMIMDFIKAGNGEGASTAMKLHILHSMRYIEELKI